MLNKDEPKVSEVITGSSCKRTALIRVKVAVPLKSALEDIFTVLKMFFCAVFPPD